MQSSRSEYPVIRQIHSNWPQPSRVSRAHTVSKTLATNLRNIHFVEPEALQHSRDCAPRVGGSGLEDAILQRGLLQLALSFFADFAFQVGVWGGEQPGVAGI